MTRPDPHAPTMDNSGHDGGPKDLARTKAGTAQRRAIQEGVKDFEEAAEEVVEKNADLYRRLAEGD